MEKKYQISELIQESMAKVREMADTNTIIGQPVHTPDGVTLIPISRVSFALCAPMNTSQKISPQ